MTNKLVYILAASHSGSTLTAMLLNSHPEIRTAGELKISSLDDPGAYRCSCRELISECRFWQDVGENMNKRGLEFDVLDAQTSLIPTSSNYVNRLIRPLHRGRIFEATRDVLLAMSPSWRRINHQWQVRNRALVESISEVSKASFVVDSSKTAVRLKFLRRIPTLDVKVIRLVRDGRAVSLTYMDSDNFADAKDPRWRGGGTGPTARPKLSMAVAARRWLDSNADADAAVNTIPRSDVIRVAYEDLCTSTYATLERIYEFLGLENIASHTNFRAIDHHVVGNGMRLDTSSDIVLDDRWKTELTEENLSTFERVAGGLNRIYGYAI